VEVLAAYSHSAQAADLQLCHTVAVTSPMPTPRPSAQRPWNLRERLDEHDIADLITAYHNGTTATSLAITHGVSLKVSSASCTPLVSAGRHPLDKLQGQHRSRCIHSQSIAADVRRSPRTRRHMRTVAPLRPHSSGIACVAGVSALRVKLRLGVMSTQLTHQGSPGGS
jgi:hypothetical protein